MNFNGREGTTVTCSNEKAFKEYKTKFLREAKNLSKLKHPHIVDILEAFEANNTCYYVMEYLEGGSFDSYIKAENGLSESEALTCIRQIGEALQFMHNNRMLHLDLKPKNIMRRKDGSIVLIDFGLSKQYNSQGEPETSTAIGYGTPGYAPIEQSCYRDGEGFPITIDIYALGATLFKTLTGKTPPNASNIMNYGFPEAELQERNISNKTITAIRHAMKPEKNARTQTVETFIQEIEGSHAEDTTLIEDSSLIVLPETNKITLSLEKLFMGSDRNFSTDIIITAKNKVRTRTFQLQYILLEFLQPDHLEGLTFVAAGTGRMINTHNRHITEVGTDKAPFVIIFFNAHAVLHMVRFLLAQNSDSTIPFLLCRI